MEESGVLYGLNALLAQAIDYAGLFPPAKLDMSAAVAGYATYAGHADAWMLGRLIVPVPRLDELESCLDGAAPSSPGEEPWHLSALTAPAGDESFPAHLARIAAFNERHADPAHGRLTIDVIELRGTTIGAVDDALDRIPDDLYPFFEIESDRDPRGLVTALVGSDAGAKIRTGGVTADLYPAPSDVARFIATCAGADVPFKATAGMHHPLRSRSDAVGAMEFGFINVLLGACMIHTRLIDEARLRELLVEEDIGAFRFEDEAIAWRDVSIEAGAIEQARERFCVSFGSCSFDEPREDLERLGLMSKL